MGFKSLKDLFLHALFCLAACLAIDTARGDWVTEFGAGVKSPRTTSLVMQEECHTAYAFDDTGESLRYYDSRWDVTSCGGDNPVFVGYPIKWERELRNGVWTISAGWFHLSHWFDGGEEREIHMDALVFSVEFNWTRWRNDRFLRATRPALTK